MDKTRQALIDLLSASFQEQVSMSVSLKPHAQVVIEFGYGRYVPIVIRKDFQPVASFESLQDIPKAVDEFIKYMGKK